MKKAMKILLIILVIIVILIVVGKRILFPPYDEIEVTGKYEIECEDYWVTEDCFGDKIINEFKQIVQ